MYRGNMHEFVENLNLYLKKKYGIFVDVEPFWLKTNIKDHFSRATDRWYYTVYLDVSESYKRRLTSITLIYDCEDFENQLFNLVNEALRKLEDV